MSITNGQLVEALQKLPPHLIVDLGVKHTEFGDADDSCGYTVHLTEDIETIRFNTISPARICLSSMGHILKVTGTKYAEKESNDVKVIDLRLEP
jgi:hypothetical protein